MLLLFDDLQHFVFKHSILTEKVYDSNFDARAILIDELLNYKIVKLLKSLIFVC